MCSRTVPPDCVGAGTERRYSAMLKVLRITAGIVFVVSILHAATLATRDCTVGLYAYDDCLWVWVGELLGLPSSKVLRAGFLELVGLALAAGLYLTIRYVFPPWRRAVTTMDGPPQPPSVNSTPR
jgi:hypothetical protein